MLARDDQQREPGHSTVGAGQGTPKHAHTDPLSMNLHNVCINKDRML